MVYGYVNLIAAIVTHKFHLHLKECEFRYNYRNFNTAKKLIFKNSLV